MALYVSTSDASATRDNSTAGVHRRHKQLLAAMDNERSDWFSHWRTLSDYYLPRRYPWLMTQKEVKTSDRTNSKLLDSTSTVAIRTLASGMMNGVTSPARPWFSLRVLGFRDEEMSLEEKIWLEEVTRRMYIVLSQSNFYNAMAILYLEWATFGTASLGIYEDARDLIRCYNYALGEFYIAQDATQRINRHGRRYERTVSQVVEEFGIDKVCATTRRLYEQKGASMLKTLELAHLIEPNAKEDGLLKTNAPFREVYLEVGGEEGKYLAVVPVYEWPNVTPRWEILGNDSYGTSPAMDALNDVKQLQSILLERGQGLAKQVRPPLIVDQQLKNRPKALGAGGLTYAATLNQNFGAKEAYRVNLPFQELAMDIQDLRGQIRETCHNNLFNMISQLDTVRSATEIDARREEKLVLLGPVLQRFYNEGLDPALKRVFGIMQRNELLPPAPASLADKDIDVQYISILSDAQRAASTFTIERFFNFAGSLAGVWPQATEVPDVDELMREYAENLGIKPKGIRSKEAVAESMEAETINQQLAQAAELGNQFSQGAKNLSQADIGGGMAALQGQA